MFQKPKDFFQAVYQMCWINSSIPHPVRAGGFFMSVSANRHNKSPIATWAQGFGVILYLKTTQKVNGLDFFFRLFCVQYLIEFFS